MTDSSKTSKVVTRPLLTRLRDRPSSERLYHEAADEIERLRAENRIMRGLLVVGPNSDELIDQRIRDELAGETGTKHGA